MPPTAPDRGLKALTQQQGLMDETRQVIKDRFGPDHFSLNFIKFTREEYVQINDKKQGRVADRNEAVQFIDNPDAIVAKAVRLLKSAEWSDKAAGLSVLTGRRSSEILSTAVFEKVSQWSVSFTGALKRRGEELELTFEIPTLTTADRVIAALKEIRQQLPDAAHLTAAQVNRLYGQSVARACDHHFAELVPNREGKDNLYTHLFRSIYATISTFWYCPPTVNDTEFKAAIQGHFAVLDEANPELRRSLAASRHYSDYEIADAVIAHHEGKRKGIKLGQAGIRPIQMFAAPTQAEESEQAEPIPQLPRHRERDRTSLRIWKNDRDRLQAILSQLDISEDYVQPDRLSLFLNWLEDHLAQPAAVERTEPGEQQAAVIAEEVTEPDSAQVEAQAPADPSVPEPSDEIQGLHQQVNELRGLIEQMQKMIQSPAPTPANQVKKVDRSIAADPSAPESPTPEQPTRDRASRYGHAPDEINRAIDAIIAYNDNQPLHDLKWAISLNAIRSYVNAPNAIEKVLKERAQELADHHQKHQLDPVKHNLRHRRKRQISHMIHLENDTP
ncbi:MAG: protelomerase family protein [Leptolyngbyaceae cyanobacterium bins.302]|nr:protelomerase family protein [Leptolyngbyaceae cyanobacterium bins.302]